MAQARRTDNNFALLLWRPMPAPDIGARCVVWGHETSKRITKGVENVSPQSKVGMSTSPLDLHDPGMLELLNVVR